MYYLNNAQARSSAVYLSKLLRASVWFCCIHCASWCDETRGASSRRYHRSPDARSTVKRSKAGHVLLADLFLREPGRLLPLSAHGHACSLFHRSPFPLSCPRKIPKLVYRESCRASRPFRPIDPLRSRPDRFLPPIPKVPSPRT